MLQLDSVLLSKCEEWIATVVMRQKLKKCVIISRYILTKIKLPIANKNAYISILRRSTGYDQFVSDYIEKRYVKQAEKDANSSAAKYLEYTKVKNPC